MKQVNVTFQFSKDCPHNLSGTCVYRGIGLVVDDSDCSNGRCKEPPSWCPLPTAEELGTPAVQQATAKGNAIALLAECQSVICSGVSLSDTEHINLMNRINAILG